MSKNIPRFGTGKTPVEFKEAKKILLDYFKQIEAHGIEHGKKVVPIIVEDIYKQNIQPLYETCVLTNEDTGKQEIVQLKTNITTHADKNGIMININADSDIEKKILYANDHGTAFGVDEDILEFYGVEDEPIQKTNEKGEKENTEFSQWYFEGSHGHLFLLAGLRKLFKTSMIG